MIIEQIEIRDKQKDSWNTFSPGWRKWDDFTMKFLQEQGDSIVEALELKKDYKVLDIASGTGEPGLTIATKVSEGFVTATDLAEGMLEIAREKQVARQQDNFYTLAADVCELPFGDNSFDAISCRLGFMFFPDMMQAAKEMVRVLKPGGKLAVTVWAEPERNIWITAMLGAIKKVVEVPATSPGEPGMFRCAQPGTISSLFEEVGIPGGVEVNINGKMNCKSIDEYWEFMNDVVPPVVAVIRSADESVKNRILKELYSHLVEDSGRHKDLTYGARLYTVRKPL
ncbi:MAG: methyltransferase domain-containing protein [Cyclobacteriaceae bacterium]|nr:methyltransferase domain-containing protein [Cyclobacteriaceae bacterium]